LALDTFCIKNAKIIRELLNSTGANSYNNYDKSHFRKACVAQLKPEATSAILDEKTKQELKNKKDGTALDRIAAFSLTIPDLQIASANCKSLLAKTVVSQILKELADDAGLAEWVQTGLLHHTGKKTTTHCRFCTSPLPHGRLSSLEAHFNDAYKMFLDEIDGAIRSIEENEGVLKNISWPGKTEFYSHLSGEFVAAKSNLIAEAKPALEYLQKLKSALSKKRQQPFASLELNEVMGDAPIPNTQMLLKVTEEVQAIILKHNKATDDFQSEVLQAREKLEKCLVAEASEEFKELTQNVGTLDSDRIVTETNKTGFDEKISSLEKEIVEHQRPAKELDEELRSYLGHDDLTFKVKKHSRRKSSVRWRKKNRSVSSVSTPVLPTTTNSKRMPSRQ
jgi:wobble nucleotide-excising tRNase